MLDLVDAFITKAQDVANSRAGLPSADSAMMLDIASEASFIDDMLMPQPMETIAMTATMSCFAGQESLGSLVRLARTGPPPPIFSADVLCRSAIDSSRPCWWLTEPRLPTVERMQRVTAESLYSAYEMGKVKSDPAIATQAKAVEERLTAYAASQAWGIGANRAVVSVGDQTRPTVRKYLEAEFGDEVAAHATWSHLSAVTHGTQYGLIQTIDIESAHGHVAIMGTSTEKLSARIEIAATVVVSSTMRFLDYMGWATDKVRRAAAELEDEIRRRSKNRIGHL